MMGLFRKTFFPSSILQFLFSSILQTNSIRFAATSKLTFWHAILFIHDMVSSPVSGLILDDGLVAELALEINHRLQKQPPETSEIQLLFLETLDSMIVNTGFKVTMPHVIDLYSTLQIVAGGENNHGTFAKRILEARISPLLAK